MFFRPGLLGRLSRGSGPFVPAFWDLVKYDVLSSRPSGTCVPGVWSVCPDARSIALSTLFDAGSALAAMCLLVEFRLALPHQCSHAWSACVGVDPQSVKVLHGTHIHNFRSNLGTIASGVVSGKFGYGLCRLRHLHRLFQCLRSGHGAGEKQSESRRLNTGKLTRSRHRIDRIVFS